MVWSASEMPISEEDPSNRATCPPRPARYSATRKSSPVITELRPYAKVLAHSISPLGDEIVTFELVMHRFVLAEFNTHRMLAKNSASSRAIPLHRQIDMLRANPALPVTWASEKSGMQGGVPIGADAAEEAKELWLGLMEKAIETALDLKGLGVHKSLTNRIIEPWMHHRVVVTGTGFRNFWDQRISVLAQPEIALPAQLMLDAYEASAPVVLQEGEFHLPYVADNDRDQVTDLYNTGNSVVVARGSVEEALASISTARCARTSYLTNPTTDRDGNIVSEAKVDIFKDLSLFEDLTTAKPAHWSPLEHPATPWAENKQTGSISFGQGDKRYEVPLSHLPKVGNLYGWRSYRTQIETILEQVTYR